MGYGAAMSNFQNIRRQRQMYESAEAQKEREFKQPAITAQIGAVNAATALDKIRAMFLGDDMKSVIEGRNAQTAGQLETNKYIGPLANSQIGYQAAGAGNLWAQAGSTNAQTSMFNTIFDVDRINRDRFNSAFSGPDGDLSRVPNYSNKPRVSADDIRRFTGGR